jgi:hypothetical protein
MKSISLSIFIVLSCILTVEVNAQINISGLTDFELRLAGDDSSPYVNQTPGDGFSVYTPNIRLFLSANISEQWFVNSVLQADHYEGKELSSPFFSVMNINWTPNFDSDFIATLGRFVTPYGSYSSRFLSNVNPFVHLPLSHATGLPVSNRYGHLSEGFTGPSTIEEQYGEYGGGLSMIYSRMYSQGIKVSHSLGESKWMNFDVAATLAPTSSHFDYAESDKPAWIGRVVFKPAIWAELGASYSKGGFILDDEASDSLLIYDLSSYPQSLTGADLTLNYRYYTLVLEWNQAFFKAPFYDPETSNSDTPRTGKATIDHISGELIYDFPFMVGGYFAVRYEKMMEGEIEIYRRDGNNNKVDQTFTPWMYDRQRIELAAGYKLDRNILLKASYLLSEDDGPNLDDDVFAIQLSVLF